MARFLLSTVWTSGDVLPFVRIGSELVKLGHEVVLVSHEVYRELAESLGITLAAIDDRAAFERFLDAGDLFRRPQGFVRIYREHVLPLVNAELQALERYATADSLIATRLTPGIAARAFAAKHQVALVAILPAPHHVSTRSLTVEFLQAALLPELDVIHDSLGLPRVRNWEAWLDAPSGYVGLWPTWFERGDQHGDSPWAVKNAGFVLGDAPPADGYPTAVEDAPILVTGGSGQVAGRDFFAAALEGLAGRSVVVVAKHKELLPHPVPRGVDCVDHVPSMMAAMGRASLVVHHGGMGSVGVAFAAGAPQLVLANGGDRPDNGERVEASGAGLCLLPGRWTANDVSGAAAQLLQPATRYGRCRELAEDVRATDGALKAAQILASGSFAPPEATGWATGRAPSDLPASLSDERRLAALTPAQRALLLERLKRARRQS